MNDDEIRTKLRRLTTTRGAHRGQMTKLLTRANELCETVNRPGLAAAGDEEATAIEPGVALQGVLDSIVSKLEFLKNIDDQIVDLTDEDSLEDVIIANDDYIENLNTKITIVKATSAKVNSKQRQQALGNDSVMNRRGDQVKRTVNLPKLQLPFFDGNMLKWQTFMDAFTSAIDRDEHLEDVQKFQYLSAQLTDEAARTIEGLQLNNANYSEALMLLRQRYGQSHKLIAAYMKALWELKKPENTVISIKQFYDSMEVYIRGLRTLGKTEDAYGDLLVPIVFEKLPGPLKTQITRDHGDKPWNIKQLRDAIYHEIQATQAGLDYSNQQMSQISSVATFHVGQSKPRRCPYCKNEHSPSECDKVLETEKRCDIVKRDKLCFNCLRPNHNVQDCRSKGRCQNCNKKHHTSICERKQQEISQREVTTDPRSTNANEIHVGFTPVNTTPSGPVLLKTAVGTVQVEQRSHTVNILLDEGAQRTFMTEDSAHKLGINMETSNKETVNLAAFGSYGTKTRQIPVCDINLVVKDGSRLKLSALVIPKISAPMKNFVPSTVLTYPYLAQLPLVKHVEKDVFDIDILIGADYYWAIVEDNVIRGPGPTAVSSKLGYLLSGPTHLNHVAVLNTHICETLTSAEEEKQELTKFWDLETVGIKDDPHSTENDSIDYETYSQTSLSLHSGKYTAKLPWKLDHPLLPTNFNVCNKRTRAVVKRLSSDTLRTYHSVIEEQLQREFIEVVEKDDISQGHYIPHHPVHKDSATTPIRIVYDCSCKQRGQPSLNDCLEPGPILMNDLVEIFIRFRMHDVGFTSDIEKAFLNVQLHEDDRKYTKFLWLSNPEDVNSPFTVYRFRVILFGAVCSPFILNAVLKKHLEAETTSVKTNLYKNIYVDNLVSGTDTTIEASKYYKEATETLHKGGFNLRSWDTNDVELRSKICEENPVGSVKVLGIRWDTDSDSLLYPTANSSGVNDMSTKRQVVSKTSSLFDPLGLVGPVMIKAKLFIQTLWQKKLDWDSPIPAQMTKEWHDIDTELNKVRELKVARKYFAHTDKTNKLELHVFADASNRAYGAAVYIKRGCDTSIVITKSRVKPLKDVTVPRLELLAAFIATKLANFVIQSLTQYPMEEIVLWCDSQIVLHWLSSNKILPRFVKNRVDHIKSGPFTKFMYCPTTDNPADLLTRGITAEQLMQSELWLRGPTWLPQSQWPTCETLNTAVFTCQADPEETVEQLQGSGIHTIIDIERFDSLEKLLRVTAYICRFLKNARKNSEATTDVQLTVKELNTAETMWIKAIQQNSFQQEMQMLKNKTKKGSSLVKQLKLFTDKEGVVRCGGRLQNAPLDYEAKYPILIPSKHHFTTLVVRRAHQQLLHSGEETTVTHIRKTLWIPKIRQTVKSILRKCVTCLKINGKPYRAPETAPLPGFRLQEAPPFTACGVDFTGCLHYKTTHSRSNKAYICLFTCAVTRAVHLELVTDMTTGAFLRAFRRFAARRSLPQRIISDNGTTFVSAATEIQELFNDPTINKFLSDRRVTWSFIPKRAPWFGGFYERLIGLTKTTLKKTLGRSLVTLDELVTLVTEVEAAVNDRPITHITSQNEGLEPLTPSKLLRGQNTALLPHRDISKEAIDDPDFGVQTAELHRRARYMDKLFQDWWKRWRNEYLPALRENHRMSLKRSGQTENVIKVGDVVLMQSDNETRVHWPLAIVVDLKTGNDGFVRSASIKTRGGVTNRPITKLFPLELNSHHDGEEKPVSSEESQDQTREQTAAVTTSRRTTRQSAANARNRIKKWTQKLL